LSRLDKSIFGCFFRAGMVNRAATGFLHSMSSLVPQLPFDAAGCARTPQSRDGLAASVPNGGLVRSGEVTFSPS
jgi:hypothetical protein